MGLRKVTPGQGLFSLGFVGLLMFGTGCVSIDPAKQSMKVQLPSFLNAEPATQLICVWQRQPVALPDATHDGSQVFGLPGQAFLLNAKGTAAEIQGDLTVVVYDETPRPNGQPPKTPYVWHITCDKLKQLVTRDDRFGKCLALYAMWPADWRDVTNVRILGRYDAPNQPTLFEPGVALTLDYSTQGAKVWQDVDPTNPGRATMQSASFETRTVPDPDKLILQAQATALRQPMPTANTPTTASAPPGLVPTPAPAPTFGYGAAPMSTPIALPQPQYAPPPNPATLVAPSSTTDTGPLKPIVIHRSRQ